MKRTRNICLPPLLLSLCLSLASVAAQAAARYNIVEIGGVGTSGNAINGSGQIAGDVNDSAGTPQAFLYANGALTMLGTLGGAESTGSAINDHGSVVGMSTTADNLRRAYLYSTGGMTCLLYTSPSPRDLSTSRMPSSA